LRSLSASRILDKGIPSEQAALEISDKFKELDEFVRSRYVAEALQALAVHGEQSDIKFGRQYLTSTYDSVKLAALRVVCRFGTAEDSGELLRIANESYGDMRDEAGVGALRLSEKPFETAVELTKSRSRQVAEAAFSWLYAQGSDEVRSCFENLLNDDSDANRVRAVYYFSTKLNTRGLTKLLKAQFDRDTYYYNVVAWLDRLLYSPGSLRNFFKSELQQLAISQR
jgi:HEAT repeat protein